MYLLKFLISFHFVLNMNELYQNKLEINKIVNTHLSDHGIQ